MENKTSKSASEESKNENLFSREEKLKERIAVLEDELLDLRAGRTGLVIVHLDIRSTC